MNVLVGEYLSTGPSLEEIQQKYNHPIDLSYGTILFLFVKYYKGKDTKRILTWLLAPPYNCSIEERFKVNNRTPLMIAARYHNIDMMQLLISHGANIHAVVDLYGHYMHNKEVLHVIDCASRSHIEEGNKRKSVIYLLDLGARKSRYKLPQYALSFLEKRKNLVGKCTILLGMRKRRCTRGLDIWMMRKITQMIWESRFSSD